jgi:hypothetical protein
VIAKRNPILWTISPSRPMEKDLVGIFPMQEFRQKTFAGVANKADPQTRISLRRIAADDHSDAATAGERESGKTDEFPFKIVGMDVHFTEQSFVKLTGEPAEWLKIWEEACDHLSKTRFSGLDISDCGMSSEDPRYRGTSDDEVEPVDIPLRVLIVFSEALARAEQTHEDGCAMSILTIDNTSDPEDPVDYTLSADVRYESIYREWEIGNSGITWDQIDDKQNTEATYEAIQRWRGDSARDRPGPHQLDLQHSQLGPNDAILVCTWLTLRKVRTQARQIFMGHVDSDITSSSIGVRGKFQLARVLGGHSAGVLGGRLLAAAEHRKVGWDYDTGPTLIETVQIDLSNRVLKLQSKQSSIPGIDWELRDLAGMGVADVCFLTGWIRNSGVRQSLKRLEVYSTGAGSREVSDYGAVKYTLGSPFDRDNANRFNEEEILRRKNLGPADSGLLASWLAKKDTSVDLKSMDLSDNRYLFDFETTRDERKDLHMKRFESWTDFCDALGASAVTNFRVGQTNLSPTPARLLFENSTKIEVLDLQGNPIAGEDPVDPAADTDAVVDRLCATTALRELVERSQVLTVLDLSKCELDAAALFDLASPAEAWVGSSIRTLLLDGNPLTSGEEGATSTALVSAIDPRADETEDFKGTAALFDALKDPGIRVTELDLSNCGMGAESANAMANALEGEGIQELLQILRLNGNRLGGIARDELPDGTLWWKAPPPSNAALADSLAKVKPALSQTHITDLDLGNCGLGPLNIKSVAQALSAPESMIRPNLCKLNVVGNPLTGSFWEKDPSWCCICSSRCQRKCSECKERVAVCGIARAKRRFYCLSCANARNDKRAKNIEDLRRIILTQEEADEDFKLSEPVMYARLQWDMAVWVAKPIEVKATTINVTVVRSSESFELSEDLSVKKLDAKSDLVGNHVLDLAGVTIGMYLVKFQGKAVASNLKWTQLRSSVKVAKKPWKFQFAARPPGSVDMDVKAMLDMAKDDGLELHIPTHTICMATALRSELSKWLKKLQKRSLNDKAAEAGKHLIHREKGWIDSPRHYAASQALSRTFVSWTSADVMSEHSASLPSVVRS